MKEWIAIGGVHDWYDGLEICEHGGGPKHIRLFYWDLFADIATFHEGAKIVYKLHKVMPSCEVKLLF